MKLARELRLTTEFTHPAHEAILNLYYTSAHIKKHAAQFFRQHRLTDVQFNVMMLLMHQGGEKGGLTQVELSRMMLVNRANITSLIDRMENGGLVERMPSPSDRRSNIVRLTHLGREKLAAVEGVYHEQVRTIMAVLDPPRLNEFIAMLEDIRENLRG